MSGLADQEHVQQVDFEPLAFRKALGSFATGVTTRSNGERFGVTANSFNSVSLEPPLVLWSLAKSSSSLAAFAESEGFAVHILAADQQDLSNRFAKRGVDKFDGLALEIGHGDVPLLPGCAARFQCRTTYRYEGGDHIIFVGEVFDFSHGEKEPLLFHAGRYATRAQENAGPERGAEQTMASDDLTYLIASSYFQLLSPVRRRAAEAGLSLAEHHALSILLGRGESRLNEVNDMIGHLGLMIDQTSIATMASRGLVVVAGATAEPGISLTDAGRALVIELIATAKAREADAQLRGDESGIRLLKQLLRRFLSGLEARDEVDPVRQHMNLMRTLTTQGKEAVPRGSRAV